MPAVWISWSMVFFCVSILDFVWDQPFSSPTSSSATTTATTNTTAPLFKTDHAISVSHSDNTALVPRIIISCIFALGLIYLVLVVRTFRSWGDPSIPPDVRESMETGRWTPRSPSPGRSPRLSRDSRLDIADEKLGMRSAGHERRTRSIDSASVV